MLMKPYQIPLLTIFCLLQISSISCQEPAIPSNYAPVLQVSSTEGFLPETAEIGTTVRVSPNPQSDSLQILVNDDDLQPGMPPATYQYILTGLGATIFAVDQRGYVYLNVPKVDADTPNPSTYELTVEAREVNTIPTRRSDPITITIHILDANDNAPSFDQPIYMANTTARGGDRPIVRVSASDPDSGIFGQISYAISQVTNGAEHLFRFDEPTQTVYATGDLVSGERYQVVVEATDGGGRSSQAIVVILAIDEFMTSMKPPLPGMETFAPFTETVPTVAPNRGDAEETIQTFVTEVNENTPPNTVVVSLGGEETNQFIYFNIVGGNEEGKFAVDDGGTIVTADTLDRETTAMYSLQVETRSRNPDQHLYWTLVQVTVMDVNDHAPVFVDQKPIRLRLSIDDIEQLSANLIIGKINVEDADSDDNGRLELRIMPPHNKLFAISNEGIVSVNGDFTAEHFGEHDVVVVARDHGDPSYETRENVQISIFGTLITMATSAPVNEIFEYTTSNEEEEMTTTPFSTITEEDLQSVNENKQQVFSSFPSPIDAPETVAPEFPQFPTLQPHPQTNEEDMYIDGDEDEEEGDGEERENVSNPNEEKPPSTTDEEDYGEDNYYETKQQPEMTTTTTTSTTTSVPPIVTTMARRLAPVFKPSSISVQVDENESQIEIAKAHAHYPDGDSGPITYILHKGDPNMFSVSSYSGSIHLLQPLDAETNSTVTIEVSTAEAQNAEIDPKLAHFAVINIRVNDKNDWIPNFESAGYEFDVNEDTLPGTVVGQVNAFDQDRDEINNRIRYRLISAGGLEAHFNVNAESGLITLARPIDAFAGEKITLRIEGADSGLPSLSSSTTVLINVVETSSRVIPDAAPITNTPNEGELQFNLRNYTASVSEAVRPPHLVQVLSVMNKPSDTRFIICNIVSGNYRGAFGITAGNDGNCELRTQMELDRETVERYLLNVSVTSGAQTDYSLVSITVLDVNDNVPQFVYESDLGLSSYFGAVSSTANAFARVMTVKAVDADIGNSSHVTYSLDPLSTHSKFFSISSFGEISTKQSMATILQRNRINFFEFRVSACDSPISGQQLCSKADVIVNVITSANRFKMVIYGLNPQQLKKHESDLIKSIRQFTGNCNLLTIEKMVEHTAIENQIRTDIYWYAVNPTNKKICKKQEIRKLFETSNVQLIAGKVQPWFRLERISEDTGDDASSVSSGILPSNWKTASILLIILAVVIAIGALVGICAVCVFWSRYKHSQQSSTNFSHSFPHKVHPSSAVYLPNVANDPRIDKIYETQMLEMPISDEDLTMKSGSMGVPAHQRNPNNNNGYRTYGYGRQQSSGYEGDFSIEESMYAINPSGRLDPVTNRVILPSANGNRGPNGYRQ